MSDCLFCKIAGGEIPSEFVYEDDDVVAFKDLNPQAPQHYLCIPRQHVSTTNDLNTGNAHLIGKLYLAAKSIAAELGVADDGYRLVMNCNDHGGQSVYHIHLHLLAGRPMSWPPG